MVGKSRDDFIGNAFQIEHLGRCGHTPSLIRLIGGTNFES